MLVVIELVVLLLLHAELLYIVKKDKMWQERQEAMLAASIYITCSSSTGHKN